MTYEERLQAARIAIVLAVPALQPLDLSLRDAATLLVKREGEAAAEALKALADVLTPENVMGGDTGGAIYPFGAHLLEVVRKAAADLGEKFKAETSPPAIDAPPQGAPPASP